MKITAVKLYILEHPERKGSGHKLVQVPNLRRTQYTHKGLPSDQPVQQTFIQVETDAGITGRVYHHDVPRHRQRFCEIRCWRRTH